METRKTASRSDPNMARVVNLVKRKEADRRQGILELRRDDEAFTVQVSKTTAYFLLLVSLAACKPHPIGPIRQVERGCARFTARCHCLAGYCFFLFDSARCSRNGTKRRPGGWNTKVSGVAFALVGLMTV